MKGVINIIDPALTLVRGHHYDWNKRLHDFYVNDGYEVRLYCNKQADKDVLNGFSSATPLFTGESYRPIRDDEKRSLDERLANELSWFNISARRFEASLRHVEPADYQLFPTLFDYQAVGVATSTLEGSIRGCLHFEPTGRGSVMGNASWGYIKDLFRLTRKSIKLFVTTPELRALYLDAHKINTQVIPYIYDVKACAAPTRHPSLTIGFLGQQRASKGLELIPTLIERLAKDRHHVILQDSSGHRQFSSNRSNVETVGYVPNIYEVIQQCDLVVTPYESNWYKYCMAGIVVESLCCGVPVIAPANCSPGNLINSTGAGETFELFTASSVYNAVQRVIERLQEAKLSAMQARENIAKNHGIPKFATALVL